MHTIEITYNDVPLYIEYDYHPEEPMVMYYADMSGHPGSAASVEILDIFANGVGIFTIVCDRIIERLEEKILEDEHS